MAWILFFCTTVIEIDGVKNKRSWGHSSFDLEPGEHTVKIYFPYIMKPECGANQVTVNLAEGESKNVSFRMPGWMFAKGKMKVS